MLRFADKRKNGITRDVRPAVHGGLVCASLLMAGLGCGVRSGGARIPLVDTTQGHQTRQPAAAGVRSPKLRMAVASMMSPAETLYAYRSLLEYLGKQLGRTPELVQRHTYAEVNEVIRHRGCDLAFVCTYPFVRGEDEFGMEALAVAQHHGSTMYRCYLIVPEDSSARSLADLHGKVFAFTDPLSFSGYVYPSYLLQQKGETPRSFFRRTLFTFSHDNSIRAVQEGLVDGAMVASFVYDEMLRRGGRQRLGTKIICRSPLFPGPPVVANPKLPADRKRRLLQTLLTMHQNPEGRRVLASMGVERFLRADSRWYAPIRSMARALEGRT